ncbi:MmpS family transport accessory protein [Mycobacterium sp. NPDC049093]
MSYPQPPYGQEPYGHPTPPPVYSAAPPPGYPPAPSPTNRTAIVALIFSLLIAPVGLVLGYVARSQIRRSHEGGAGLAVAAIIIGWIWTLASIVIAIAIFTGAVVVFTGAGSDTATSDASTRTNPNHPGTGIRKRVTYEVWGNGSSADINYLDLDATPQRIDDAALPWTLTLDSTDPSVYLNITAQSDGDSIGCRITVDDKIQDERTSDGANAQTFCLMKSG